MFCQWIWGILTVFETKQPQESRELHGDLLGMDMFTVFVGELYMTSTAT